MKKLLLLLMSIVMIFTLSGCESSEKVISIYGVVAGHGYGTCLLR